MSDNQHVVLLGGHGKVALRATHWLAQAGCIVRSVIRDPDQAADVLEAGGYPEVLDIESASAADFAALFQGAGTVVFSAGAGGKGPAARTWAIDRDGAITSMDAAIQAGVGRYVMVSYARALDHYQALTPEDSFYPYAKAKHDADAYLRQSALAYTILGPGLLTLEPASRALRIADAHGEVGPDWPEARKCTSRDNVALAITHVITAGVGQRRTINFYDGDTPLAEALADPV